MKILSKKNLIIFIILALTMILPGLKEVFAVKTNSGPIQVQYTAKDGFNLIGLLNIPKKASAKNKVPLVIFLHAIGRSQIDWGTLPAELKNINIASFTLDLRGHGQSLTDKFGKKIYWENFKDTAYKKFPGDVISGIAFLKENYPEIDQSRIAIVGASIGATTAILSAKQENKITKTLILLAPAVTYKGLDVRIALVDYGVHPVLFVTSKNDIFSYQASTELMKYAQGNKVMKVYPNGCGDGMDALRFHPDSKSMITSWLKKYLATTK